MINKKILICVLFYLLIISCFSDGKAYSFYENSQYIPELHQNKQLGIIDYSDGIETLYLSVELPLENQSKILWILPIKSNEKDLKVEILDKFPIVKGKTKLKQGAILESIAPYLFLNSFYNFSIVDFFITGMAIAIPRYSKNHDIETNSDIKFYDSLTKYGITLDYKSVKNMEDFDVLLKNYKNKISNIEKEKFSSYFSEDYTMIFVTISDLNKFKEKFSKSNYSPGLKFIFKSDKIFYPMAATLTYKDYIDVEILILGFAKIDNYKDWWQPRSRAYLIDKLDGLENNGNYQVYTKIRPYYTGVKNKFSDIFFNVNAYPTYKYDIFYTRFYYIIFLLIYLLICFKNFIYYYLTLFFCKYNRKKYPSLGWKIFLGIPGILYQLQLFQPNNKTYFYKMIKEINVKKIVKISLFFVFIYVVLFFMNYLRIMLILFSIKFLLLLCIFLILKIDFFIKNTIFRVYFLISNFIFLLFVIYIIFIYIY